MTKNNKMYAVIGSVPALMLTSGIASAQGLADLFGSVQRNFAAAVPMIMILAFLGGIFFAISAMLKMKDAKENPRDNSAGTIALNWVAAIFLIFLGGGILMMRETLGLSEQDLSGAASVTYN